MASVFLTGGSGFVGSRLLPVLRRTGHRVVALDRSRSLRARFPAAPDVRIVTGNLLDADSYREALATADTVVHLAASTGRASRDEHVRVNALGTQTLVEECQRARVSRLLFVSSIAAAFPDRTGYPYAEAKVRAEEAVQRSGLAFAILRPTMIFGEGSPVLAGLEALALMPVIPVFGNGRTLVQPVHVDDVVRFILRVIDQDFFSNETYEVGGRETVTIEDLLQRIRQARRGRRGPRLHVPIGLLLAPLRAAGAVGLGGLLPISAGQLSSFRFRGTVASNRLQDSLQGELLGVAEMLAATGGARPSSAASLDRECRVFAAHVLRCSPDDYVLRKYAEAHRLLPELSGGDRFDRFLLSFARVHRVFTGIADGYARIFIPASPLRQKLTLVLAILETSAPSFRLVDEPVGGRRMWVLVRLALRGTAALIGLAIGTIVFGPARLLFSQRAR